jgi:hypothetical protein
MTEGEVLQLHNRPTTESAYKPRNDRSLELIHAGETRAANAETLDFSPLSGFSVATRPYAETVRRKKKPLRTES